MFSYLFLGVVVCSVTGNGAVDVEILKPVKNNGDEIGLIFLPDSFVDGEQYKKTAEAIQNASDFCIWVALTKDYPGQLVNPSNLKTAMSKATKALGDAGMTSKTFVGVAHGIPGFHLRRYNDQTLGAIIFLGSSLDRDVRPNDYPIPSLTLVAELDGITRITRYVQEYEQLKEDLKKEFTVLYKHPMIVIEGANHREFASGKMNKKIDDEDLEAEISEEQAHDAIAKHVNTFLVATFSSSLDKQDVAFMDLENAYFDMEKIFQPFLDIRHFDRKGNISRWTVLAQERFASEFVDEILVTNKLLDVNSFYLRSDPEVKTEGNKVIVETTSHIDDDDLEFDLQPDPEGPREIAMKLNTKEAVRKAVEALGDRSNVGKNPEVPVKFKTPTCKSLNQLAVEIALNQSNPAAQKRYHNRGRKVILEDDSDKSFYPIWVIQALDAKEKDDGLHVKAVSFLNAMKGEHYCKLLTPFRAMEWINVDALRKP